MANRIETIYALVNGSTPTDKIILDEAAVSSLYDMAQEGRIGEAGKIGWSDIFFANTIPLYDCIISMPSEPHRALTRVFIDREVVNALSEGAMDCDKSGFSRVGGMCFFFDEADVDVLTADIHVKRGGDGVKFTAHWMLTGAELEENHWDMLNTLYTVWYLVMVSLLHPVTRKQILNHSRQERYKRVVGTGKHKRGIIRYVRRIDITEDDLSITDDADGEKRKYNVLCWYVSGHWRHYKDGKVVFIKPYWKGELRETKKADETRLREIVTEGVQLC